MLSDQDSEIVGRIAKILRDLTPEGSESITADVRTDGTTMTTSLLLKTTPFTHDRVDEVTAVAGELRESMSTGLNLPWYQAIITATRSGDAEPDLWFTYDKPE